MYACQTPNRDGCQGLRPCLPALLHAARRRHLVPCAGEEAQEACWVKLKRVVKRLRATISEETPVTPVTLTHQNWGFYFN